jgi:rubrerythrin
MKKKKVETPIEEMPELKDCETCGFLYMDVNGSGCPLCAANKKGDQK